MEGARQFVDGRFGDVIKDLKRIACIAAPPFGERKRIEYLRDCVQKMGYENTEIDGEGNLIAKLNGAGNGLLVFSAHVDTVFPEGTKLEAVEEDGKIRCPGVCDNAMGVVALLYLMRYLKEEGIRPKSDAVFLFNVGEEEAGNLRGIRRFFGEHGKIRAHVCVEGGGLGRLTRRFAGSHRARVKVSCKGGHSWRDYGNANAIIVASRLIARLSEIRLPVGPKTTFNIGTIKGGITVNSIPSDAEFTFEIRSLDQKAMASAKNWVLGELGKGTSGAEIRTEVIGDRPCGETTDGALLETIRGIQRQLGIKTIDDDGSTDSNYPASLGLPSVTIGITDAEGMHSTKEFLYVEPVRKGIEQLLLVFRALDG